MEKKDRTRLALIINNKEFEYLNNRNGSEIDLWGMEALLEELGYLVIIKENLTAVVSDLGLWDKFSFLLNSSELC